VFHSMFVPTYQTTRGHSPEEHCVNWFMLFTGTTVIKCNFNADDFYGQEFIIK